MTDEQLEQLSKSELIALVRELFARLERAERRIAELEAQVMQLTQENARLKKNSSNSSKPPSSDIVKPPSALRGGGCGQALGVRANLVIRDLLPTHGDE